MTSNDSRNEDEVFEEITRVMKNITGENTPFLLSKRIIHQRRTKEAFGPNAKLLGGNKSEKLLDEYYDSHAEIIMNKGELYTPHFLEWLIKKEEEE